MNKWTYNSSKDEALKFKKRSDFDLNSRGAYEYARRHGILDDICSHMKRYGNKQYRCIYVYEFSNMTAYVGLTYNLNVRNIEHMNSKRKLTSVGEYMLKTKGKPNLIQLTEYISVEKASELEIYYIGLYINDGWKLLNKVKGGCVGGGHITWTKNNCENEALKYNTRLEFQKNSGSAYQAARKNNWLDELCVHMTKIIKPKNYWNFERCKIEASKYKRKIDFKKESQSAYQAARKNNWLNIIFEY